MDLSVLFKKIQLDSKRTTLDLTNLGISGKIPLEVLKEINKHSFKKLVLNMNALSSLDGVENLSSITVLEAAYNNITVPFSASKEILAKSKLSKTLKDIDLSFNKVETINFISAFTELNTINLSANSIADISPLKNLTKLSNLNIRDNNLISIKPLDVSKFSFIDYSENNI